MEKLVDKGKTRMIGMECHNRHVRTIDSPDLGVSNFSSPKIKRLISGARIHPVVNQVELNPYFPQKGLFRTCQAANVHVTAFGPLGCTPVPVLIGRQGPGPLQDPVVNMPLLQKRNMTKWRLIDSRDGSKVHENSSSSYSLFHAEPRCIGDP